jgi:biotin transport system substrate-specific component
MSNQLSISNSPVAPSRLAAWVRGSAVLREGSILRSGAIVLAGSALLAICSHIALPLYFTPVPLTLQTFAVLLIGLLLSPQLAAGTIIAYLAECALGLPVFAPAPALTGLAHLLGPMGGYLMSYPVAAAVTGMLSRHIHRGIVGAAFSAAVGSIVILACGALWLNSFAHMGAASLLASAILPFLPGDMLKVTAAALVAFGLRRPRLIKT